MLVTEIPRSFAPNWKRAICRTLWVSRPRPGVWRKPPVAKIPRYAGRGAPAAHCRYGKQRPVSVRDAILPEKDWKTIRWRHGTKGWLESRFLVLRVQPSHGFVRGRPPHKEV